ncbi:redox-sensitive transcriptional regulator [Gracilibacillus boraciitolerans JCM 21714]|uniref:Redox-sensitive transcriptional regulator n=1 Tax=Gracilibacillus boraciitolerans JCM 21714 TaxID=1298598 RepID=W4VQF7_9BACI|nr:redox-sensitive transcriptional regulator [Gracilibacillus boraciitolerans JCM 21714]
MAFDVDEAKIGKKIGDVEICHIDEIEEKVANISVVILTVPVSEAQTITDRLVAAGITGILNFTPARITVPEKVRVHHIDLAVELQSLVYFMKHYPLEVNQDEE